MGEGNPLQVNEATVFGLAISLSKVASEAISPRDTKVLLDF
jgi:hypothetical protein